MFSGAKSFQVQILALSPSSLAIVDSSLPLSGPQFPPLNIGDSTTHFTG